MDKHDSVEPAPPGRSLGSLLAYGISWVAVAVAFALLAPMLGMGTIHFGILLHFLAVVVLAAQGVRLVGRGLSWQVGVLVATLVAVYVVFAAEVAIMSWYLHRHPPDRPMFHNRFVQDERALLPFWYPPIPRADRYGHWLWSDFEDNALVVVVTGIPRTSRYGSIDAGQDAIRFRVGDDAGDRFVTIERTENVLIVILPDGKVGRFSLSQGLARSFFERASRVASENFLREACDLLDASEKQKCDAFLATYSEPIPGDSEAPVGVLVN